MLTIKHWAYLPMPTYSDHSCIFNHFSPSLWLWKMNWDLECLIFFTHWPLCWMLDLDELEMMEIIPGTPDSNHSPDQLLARRQLSARRTSIIHQHIHNEIFPSIICQWNFVNMSSDRAEQELNWWFDSLGWFWNCLPCPLLYLIKRTHWTLQEILCVYFYFLVLFQIRRFKNIPWYNFLCHFQWRLWSS